MWVLPQGRVVLPSDISPPVRLPAWAPFSYDPRSSVDAKYTPIFSGSIPLISAFILNFDIYIDITY